MSDPHLLVAISGHGLGHLSQASAVINGLYARWPGLRLSRRSPLATEVLQHWIHPAFVHHAGEDDIGMRMASALDVDLAASEAAYAELHQHWEARVGELAAWLQARRVTLVLADIAYLPLAAAQQAGIANVALCSLNWADVMAHYLVGDEAQRWLAQAQQAYQRADRFLLPTPSMPMPWLHNTQAVAPIGRVGHAQRELLCKRLGVSAECHLVLVGMGGVGLSAPQHEWPLMIGTKPVHYLLPDAAVFDASVGAEQTFHAISSTEMEYHHLMASVDIMLTKPGYGTFVEAAATGLPVLYVTRQGWPDVESLTSWLQEVGRARSISREALDKGDFHHEMAELLKAGRYPAVAPNGAAQVADLLLGDL